MANYHWLIAINQFSHRAPGLPPHFDPTRCGYCLGMARISQSKTGKVEEHGKAVGTVSPQDVEQRAREIARIAGRDRPTPEDRIQARDELLDRDLPPTVAQDAAVSMQSLSRDPSDPAVDRGRQAPEYIENDEEEGLERLALEGVEEAQHDQMVEARNAESDEVGEPGSDVGEQRPMTDQPIKRK